MIPEGTLSILNCNDGDTRISFDTDNPKDVARAKATIADMLKRGYLLFVDEGDGKLRRVKRFSSKRNEYIVSEVPGDDDKKTTTPVKKKKAKERAIPARKAKATAIGRTAGG